MASPVSKRGFATLGATVTCLCIAIGLSAVISYGSVARRSAQTALDRTKAEALLDSGHLLAALAIFENVQDGRLRWSESRDVAAFQILAEPEFDKFPAADLAMSPSAELRALGDIASASRKIQAEVDASRVPNIAAALPNPLWQSCGPSMVSYYGRASEVTLRAAASPQRSGQQPRAGQVWRVVVQFNDWQDERLIRMSDNPAEPAQLINRRLRKGVAGSLLEEPCANLFTV